MILKKLLIIALICNYGFLSAQSYPPQAGEPGSTAIYKDSPLFKSWATGIEVVRGFLNKSDPNFAIAGNTKASSGNPTDCLGYPDGFTVSLGDEGSATLTFASPIIDGPGFDFAIFENGSDNYLELAFVEVSSDGTNFFRFASNSETQTNTQIGTFGSPAANYLNNLAGKYSGTYGTPFDLSELAESELLNKNNITHVKIIDVVGSIDPEFATFDSVGNAVNESFPTPFPSCGFDLQAVGVINQQTLGLFGQDKLDIIVFPNPVADRLFISEVDHPNVIFYDAQGRIVIDENYSDGIDVSGLKNGIYLIDIVINPKKWIKQKIVIQR